MTRAVSPKRFVYSIKIFLFKDSKFTIFKVRKFGPIEGLVRGSGTNGKYLENIQEMSWQKKI
jgi:hypothetical protein